MEALALSMKIVGFILVLLAGVSFSGYLYFFKWQSIDTLPPPEFSYCGSQIWGANPKYIEITNWLKENEEGWTRSFGSFDTGIEYLSGSYRINVLKDMVIVAHKTDYGFPQFVKKINHGLSLDCEKS